MYKNAKQLALSKLKDIALPSLLFAAVAFLITAPLFREGYVFLIDMVWGPNRSFADLLINGLTPGLPINTLFVALSFIIPPALLQKLVLTFVLFLPGATMYLLARRYMIKSFALTSGLLYMLNPFVYERFLGGHWNVLLGYGYFPLVILAFLGFLRVPSTKRFALFTVLFAIYPLVSIHWTYITAAFLAVLVLVNFVQSRALNIWLVLKRSAAFIATFLLVNAFWLFNFFDPSQKFAKFSTQDFDAFITLSDKVWGVFFNVLSLYGFWYREYFLPKDFFSLWWVVTLVLLFFGALGAYRAIRRRDTLGITLAICFIPVFLVAVGYGHDVTGRLTDTLIGIAPLFEGLRDSSKLIGFLAFSYALLVPYALIGLSSRVSRLKWPSLVLLFLLPFLSAGALLWGARGQLRAYSYPEGWYEADDVLTTDPSTERVLVLPWNLYPVLDFAGYRAIANPAHVFFTPKMIAGQNTDNPFLVNAESEENPWYRAMLALIHQRKTVEETLGFFEEQSVSHVVLTKTDDWERYLHIVSSPELQNIYESDAIAVYRIQK